MAEFSTSATAKREQGHEPDTEPSVATSRDVSKLKPVDEWYEAIACLRDGTQHEHKPKAQLSHEAISLAREAEAEGGQWYGARIERIEIWSVTPGRSPERQREGII